MIYVKYDCVFSTHFISIIYANVLHFWTVAAKDRKFMVWEWEYIWNHNARFVRYLGKMTIKPTGLITNTNQHS